MLAKEELLLIVYFIVVILLLTAFVIVFFVVYRKRKNQMLQEKYEAEKRFEQEIFKSRLEIQEQTLKNVGWELHDNIGQLLSVAKMQLNILSSQVDKTRKEQVHEIGDVVGSSLQEVRSLSKSLNMEVVEHLGLENSIKNELERYERMNVLQTSFRASGKKVVINPKDAIIVFRILQEFFSNVLKHAKAKSLEVHLNYEPEKVTICVEDNGVGFDPEAVEKHSGLINMKSRAGLVGAGFKFSSIPGNGTKMILHYPLRS